MDLVQSVPDEPTAIHLNELTQCGVPGGRPLRLDSIVRIFCEQARRDISLHILRGEAKS